VGKRTARQKTRGFLVVQGLPIEALPIPYVLTDFGRCYLAELRAKEARAARVTAVQRYTGLQWLTPVPRPTLSPRTTSRRVSIAALPSELLAKFVAARWLPVRPLDAATSPEAR
jgi:hypothetical protein